MDDPEHELISSDAIRGSVLLEPAKPLQKPIPVKHNASLLAAKAAIAKEKENDKESKSAKPIPAVPEVKSVEDDEDHYRPDETPHTFIGYFADKTKINQESLAEAPWTNDEFADYLLNNPDARRPDCMREDIARREAIRNPVKDVPPPSIPSQQPAQQPPQVPAPQPLQPPPTQLQRQATLQRQDSISIPPRNVTQQQFSNAPIPEEEEEDLGQYMPQGQSFEWGGDDEDDEDDYYGQQFNLPAIPIQPVVAMVPPPTAVNVNMPVSPAAVHLPPAYQTFKAPINPSNPSNSSNFSKPSTPKPSTPKLSNSPRPGSLPNVIRPSSQSFAAQGLPGLPVRPSSNLSNVRSHPVYNNGANRSPAVSGTPLFKAASVAAAATVIEDDEDDELDFQPQQQYAPQQPQQQQYAPQQPPQQQYHQQYQQPSQQPAQQQQQYAPQQPQQPQANEEVPAPWSNLGEAHPNEFMMNNQSVQEFTNFIQMQEFGKKLRDSGFQEEAIAKMSLMDRYVCCGRLDLKRRKKQRLS